MIYQEYTIGGELMHSAKGVEWKNKKYIDKVRTKTGKWRYIYKNTKSKAKHYFTGGKLAKQRLDLADSRYRSAQNKLEEKERKENTAHKNYQDNFYYDEKGNWRANYNDGDSGQNVMRDKIKYEYAQADTRKAKNERDKAGAEAGKAARDYYDHTLKGQIDKTSSEAKDKIDNGRDVLADLLDKLEGKVRSKRKKK